MINKNIKLRIDSKVLLELCFTYFPCSIEQGKIKFDPQFKLYYKMITLTNILPEEVVYKILGFVRDNKVLDFFNEENYVWYKAINENSVQICYDKSVDYKKLLKDFNTEYIENLVLKALKNGNFERVFQNKSLINFQAYSGYKMTEILKQVIEHKQMFIFNKLVISSVKKIFFPDNVLSIFPTKKYMFKNMLSKGFDLLAPYSKGRTCLSYCASIGATRMVKLLLKYGANDNYDYRSFSIINAVANGHIEIVKLLVDYRNNNPLILYGNNWNIKDVLFWACLFGRINIVGYTLEKGVSNINNQYYDPTLKYIFGKYEKYNGRVPFIEACRRGHNRIIKILLNTNKIDINEIDKFGDTALKVAFESHKYKTVRILLNFGAKFNYSKDCFQYLINNIDLIKVLVRKNTLTEDIKEQIMYYLEHRLTIKKAKRYNERIIKIFETQK